jgi:hypothetical protein
MHLFSACFSEPHVFHTRERECCHSLYHVGCTAFCDMLWTHVYCTLLLIIHNNFEIGKRQIQQSPFEYFENFNIVDKKFSFVLFNRRCMSLYLLRGSFIILSHIFTVIIIVGYRYLGIVQHWTSLTGSILKEGRVFFLTSMSFLFPPTERMKKELR